MVTMTQMGHRSAVHRPLSPVYPAQIITLRVLLFLEFALRMLRRAVELGISFRCGTDGETVEHTLAQIIRCEDRASPDASHGGVFLRRDWH